MSRITIGTEFRHTHHEENPLWRVTKQVAPGVWSAYIVNEPITVDGVTYDSDDAGHDDVFKEQTIEAALRRDESYQALKDAHTAFWARQEVGSVLHYDDGFGKFVRGVVVELPPEDIETYSGFRGTKGIQPIALVGDWSDWDLKSTSHHARKVLDHAGAWAPNPSCVFESPNHVKRPKSKDFDPTTAQPLTVKGS